MQKIRNTKSLKAVRERERERERELYFNEEKYGIVLDTAKNIDSNVINNIKNKTKPIKI